MINSKIMAREKVILEIGEEIARELEELLERENMDFYREGIPEDAELERYTAKFSNGIEADIKLCSGQDNLFVDPVLFDSFGRQIGLLEPADGLLGEYVFEFENKEYMVGIVAI